MDERVYAIVRFYENDRAPFVIQKGLTIDEARAYCNDTELSSITAKSPKGCGGDPKKIQEWHDKKKHWFVGFCEM